MCFYGVANFLFVRELVCILQILVFIIISFQQRGKFSYSVRLSSSTAAATAASESESAKRRLMKSTTMRKKDSLMYTQGKARQVDGGNGLKNENAFGARKQFSFLRCLSFVKFKFVQFKLIPFCHRCCEIWGKNFYWISKDVHLHMNEQYQRLTVNEIEFELKVRRERTTHASSSSVKLWREENKSIEQEVKSNICLGILEIFLFGFHLNFNGLHWKWEVNVWKFLNWRFRLFSLFVHLQNFISK